MRLVGVLLLVISAAFAWTLTAVWLSCLMLAVRAAMYLGHWPRSVDTADLPTTVTAIQTPTAAAVLLLLTLGTAGAIIRQLKVDHWALAGVAAFFFALFISMGLFWLDPTSVLEWAMG